MAYTPQTWTDGVSKLNATRMGHIETGIADIHNLVDAKGDLYTATAADTPARLAVGANNTVVTADSAQSTGLKYSLVTNSMVDAAAAIAYSKLNLTGGIVNADVNASAAIAFSKLAGAYSAYTPALTASTSNPTLGSGSVASGRYNQIGKIVHCYGRVQFGTSGAAAGSGTYSISLPVTAATTISLAAAGGSRLFDSSASAMALPDIFIATSTTFQLIHPATWPSGTQALVTAAAPWTWAASDQLNWNIIYEAA